MGKKIKLHGEKFGRLTVLEEAAKAYDKEAIKGGYTTNFSREGVELCL